MKIQHVTNAIDVTDWPVVEFVYPEGARDKSLLICPAETRSNFLVPGRAYLFKQSSHNYPEQFWGEVLTYRLGCLIGVPVPPAFVAYNRTTGVAGALIEWFLKSSSKATDLRLAARVFVNVLSSTPMWPLTRRLIAARWPDAAAERYVPGGDTMQRIIPNFDRKRGTQHNWEDTRIYCRTLHRNRLLRENWERTWAQIFALDSLIGNTDRHQDNWGIIWRYTARNITEARLTPAFDNGTSMGHEIMSARFQGFDDDARTRRYVERGTHHMKWRRNDANRLSHIDFLKHFCEEHREARKWMLECLQFNPQLLKPIVLALTQYDVPTQLTLARAHFMLRLLTFRQQYFLSELTVV